ncbi:peptide chain release factor N(5)-glutamine methyltransferase [Pleionea sediminis]|uniref:peptide chain release factor N(5)-glutamine methyltransferase n=1 Tax=Pleionea sediminis TaxID=2569479 RepID=UPI00197C55C1|nr:peptide chain release factor N(5)-glutamine methyltransferase [Pleionea sediminis]
MTPNSILAEYLPKLPDADCNRIDAEILIAAAMGKNRSWLRAYGDEPIDDSQLIDIRALLERRVKGEPVAHIIGEWEFYSLVLKVTPDTLIPRPETELLVDWALSVVKDLSSPKVLDLGTGTGAIAIAIKYECDKAKVTAVENSLAALKVAQENARLHKLNINFLQGSWFEPIESEKQFHIIVSNPPYIAKDDEHLRSGDLKFEPSSALTAGDDEYADIKQIIEKAPNYLINEGWLAIEHGYNQAEEVISLFEARGFKGVKNFKDYGNNPRFTIGQWHS